MDPKTRRNGRLEVTRGIKEGKTGVDRNYEDPQCKGVIRGVAIMTAGFVKDDRGWEIDSATLDQVVAAGSAVTMGLKSRFGHPGMCTEAMGTFIGRCRNFTRDGNVARADLFINRTAYSTPQGDIGSYVLELAEKDPDAFGTSVVLGKWELERRLNTDNTPKKDEKGNAMPPLLRVKTLLAADVVDNPAANNGMFGMFTPGVELSAAAYEALDMFLSNPDALERLMSFLERYRSNQVDIDQNKPSLHKQEGVMDEFLKTLTLEQLSAGRPDLVTKIKADAGKESTSAERARALGIVKVVHAEFPAMGMEPLVEEALENGLTQDAALANIRGKRLADLQKDSNKAPGAAHDDGAPKTHLQLADAYQAEHKCSRTEALRATAPKRK